MEPEKLLVVPEALTRSFAPPKHWITQALALNQHRDVYDDIYFLQDPGLRRIDTLWVGPGPLLFSEERAVCTDVGLLIPSAKTASGPTMLFQPDKPAFSPTYRYPNAIVHIDWLGYPPCTIEVPCRPKVSRRQLLAAVAGVVEEFILRAEGMQIDQLYRSINPDAAMEACRGRSLVQRMGIAGLVNCRGPVWQPVLYFINRL